MHISDEENLQRLAKRSEAGDANAMSDYGCYYAEGKYGLPKDHGKALERGIGRENLVVPKHIPILDMLMTMVTTL